MDIWRVQMQKALSANWNFLLKFLFFSGSYVFVQLFTHELHVAFTQQQKGFGHVQCETSGYEPPGLIVDPG